MVETYGLLILCRNKALAVGGGFYSFFFKCQQFIYFKLNKAKDKKIIIIKPRTKIFRLAKSHDFASVQYFKKNRHLSRMHQKDAYKE